MQRKECTSSLFSLCFFLLSVSSGFLLSDSFDSHSSAVLFFALVACVFSLALFFPPCFFHFLFCPFRYSSYLGHFKGRSSALGHQSQIAHCGSRPRQDSSHCMLLGARCFDGCWRYCNARATSQKESPQAPLASSFPSARTRCILGRDRGRIQVTACCLSKDASMVVGDMR